MTQQPPERRVVLYERADCHLCDEVRVLLDRVVGPSAYEHIDVDSDAALAARYGDRVPVLTDAAGNELCHGRLDPAVLERIQ